MKFINWIKSLFAPSSEGAKAQETAKPCASPKSNAQTTPYEWALSQLGVNERTHPATVKKYLQVVRLGNYDPRETAWCAAFVNWCLAQSGIQGTGKPNARSFLHVGDEVKVPQKGDIVVFWRSSKKSWKGHVAFFNELTSSGDIVVLGGNQNNEVCYKIYPKERLLGYRRV